MRNRHPRQRRRDIGAVRSTPLDVKRKLIPVTLSAILTTSRHHGLVAYQMGVPRSNLCLPNLRRPAMHSTLEPAVSQMRELTYEEVISVSGGDRGDAFVGGAAAGGTLGWAIVRGSAWGARLGMAGGAAGAFGGAIIGAMVGVAIYKNYM